MHGSDYDQDEENDKVVDIEIGKALPIQNKGAIFDLASPI